MITVDCGSPATDFAASIGLDVVITDHECKGRGRGSVVDPHRG